MSQVVCRSLAIAQMWLLVCASHALAATEVASHADTYVTADGTTYFALSLAPSTTASTGDRDVVILFDTSASQTSLYRDKALAALEVVLGGLNRADRFQLVALDLDPVPLSDELVTPGSAEADLAVAKLKQRAPLGATDLPAGLRRAAALLSKSNNERVVLYIGDGMSTAAFMTLDEYRQLTAELADQHVSISSFAVGPRTDAQLLASLAMQTGGMLVIDGESVDAKQAGQFLVSAVRGSVYWPRDVQWPAALSKVYPRRMPPLRSDRDSIVVGKTAESLGSELKLAITTDSAGKPAELSWALPVAASNPDFSFLTSLVEAADVDDGLRMICLGTPGLKETRRLVNENTQLVAKLSGQALASGNFEVAERLADEALRRDPQDETAQGVKKQVAKQRAAANEAADKQQPAAPPASVEEKKTSDVSPQGGQVFQAFAVPDDLRLGPQAQPKAKPAPRQPTKPAAKAPAGKPAANKPATASKPAAGGATKPVAKAQPQVLHVAISAGDDPEVAWNDYFASHEDVKAEDIRATVRQLMRDRKTTEVIALVKAALRNGRPQPWMYEVLGLAMQINGSSKSEIERALMSAVDFGDSGEDLMYVAQYMARAKLESRALKVFRQVTLMEPLRPEPYLFGLQLAQQTNDLEGLKWSSLGILRQAWPKEKQDVVQSATRSAAAAIARLKSEGRLDEARQFQAELDRAKVRDCIVKVTWTGEADVDLLVEEPSGTIASFRNPRTPGGGVILGGGATLDSRGSAAAHSEIYECPEAFNGNYKVLVRRVWGKVAAGKVTVDLYAHQGTPQEKHLQHQIPLGEEDALVTFDLADGRRKEPLADHLLANAAATQATANQAILAQQVTSMAENSPARSNLGVSRQGMFAVPFAQQAVGYMPVIITLPTGASMSVNGVVSADRRYVRISPFPFFSSVGSVTTFNIASGSTGTTQNGTAGSGAVGNNPGTTGATGIGGAGT